MGLYEDDGEFIDDLIAFDTANKYEKSRNSGKKNGCYIATCVYGSYDCPEVWTLRRFRDDVLRQHSWGRMFVKVYYRISPGLVAKYGSANWFRRIWRRFLDIMVDKLHAKGIEDTKYTDWDQCAYNFYLQGIFIGQVALYNKIRIKALNAGGC